jgi:hypothetical protein
LAVKAANLIFLKKVEKEKTEMPNEKLASYSLVKFAT